MTYAVKRHLGYEPWGVTNPWVYADLSQPQRRRVPSKYIWQTHPPREGMHPLGQIPGLTAGVEALTAAERRGRRMEVYSLIGIALTSVYLWKAMRPGLTRNKGRRRRR
jgi:hypothetical protein